MGLIQKMTDKMRDGLRRFLQLTPAPENVIVIDEGLDFLANCAKNRIWYHGKSRQLSQLYSSLDGVEKTMFWAAPMTRGLEIRKLHTGLAKIVIDMLTAIVSNDFNGMEITAIDYNGTVTLNNSFKYQDSAAAVTDPITANKTIVPSDSTAHTHSFTYSVDGKTITATLADNATAKALAEKLKAGSVTVEMKANGFEHYGPLGFSLERHDEEITAASGDIMLYNGNNICVFYGNNSWSYTPLGKVDGKTADELKAFFGTGSVTVTYSMKQ